MSKTDAKERQAIQEMVSREASLGYLRATSANVETTILRGSDVVQTKDGKETVVTTITKHVIQPSGHYTLK